MNVQATEIRNACMQHRFMKAVKVFMGAVPVATLTLLLSAGVSVILPAPSAQAAGSQCVWEGGSGASAGYAYCAAEDCVGRGGFAQCSAGVGAVPIPFTDSQVRMDKWIYVYDNTYSNAPVWAMWCHAAGGTWDVSTANPQCIDLPSDLLGMQVTNQEARAIEVADAFATLWMGSCAPWTVNDTNWSLSQQDLGIPTVYNRTRTYTGTSCNTV